MYLEREHYRHWVFRIHLDGEEDDYDHERFDRLDWFLHITENCNSETYDFVLNLDGYGYYLDMFGLPFDKFEDRTSFAIVEHLKRIAAVNLLDYMYQYVREVRI